MNIISTALLTKSFGGNTAVNQVSIDVKEKQCTGIIGTNGSGKNDTPQPDQRDAES